MKKLTVCGVNISKFTIVVPETPHPAEKRAAEFLQRVIRISCGLTLPISDQKAAHSIVIGSAEKNAEIKWDGFRMATDEANVYLHGNIPRGTLYAAYDFAEKYLGYRFFFDDCEVIPKEGSADVPSGLDIIDNPGFAARRTTCWQHLRSAELSAHSRINDCVPVDETYGGVDPANGDCHSFYKLVPADRYFDDHPEYYALFEGKRIPCHGGHGPGQLCLTNPDVIRVATENVREQLRANPNMKYVEVSHCDNSRFCQCEKCTAVFEEEGSHSGTMLRFVNAIAEAIEEEFPHVLVRTFAYQDTRKPPKITKARHNVLVRYCTIEACFRHALNDPNCRNGEVFGKELKEWGKKADHLSIWDYVTNWSCYNAPYPNLESMYKNMRIFYESNAIHMFEECNDGYGGNICPEMKAYLLAKLMWNPLMSEEEYEGHITDFMSHFYGKGWKEIRRILEILQECTAHRCIGTFDEIDRGHWEAIEYSGGPYFMPTAYQVTFKDHYLMEFVERLPEVKACLERACDRLDLDSPTKKHLDIARFSILYTDLFLKPHFKANMTKGEQKVYEAQVEMMYEDKERLGLRWCIHGR